MSIAHLIKQFNLEHKIRGKKIWIDINDMMKQLIIDEDNKILSDLMENDTINVKSFGNKYYLHESKVKSIIKTLKTHPEHYNVHRIFDLNIKFTKQQEIETLAILYEHYRGEYHVHYQHPELEFRMDMCIVLELNQTGGLCIEIDENGHGKYDKKDHEDRQKILESCGYHFVRIKPGQYSDDQLIELVEREIKDYKLLHSVSIDVNILWNELKKNGIDKQFFDMISKSIVCDKKFCVDFDDIVEFIGYARKDVAKKLLIKRFRNEIDYVTIKKQDLEDRDDIYQIYTEKFQNDKSRNKIYIFLTKYSFYSFILQANTEKAKQIRAFVIEIYNKYHGLLMYFRKQNIKEQDTINTKNKEALELYKERQDKKLKNCRDTKNREIKDLKATNNNFKKMNNEQRETILHLNHNLDSSKITNDKLNKELIKFKKNINTNTLDIKDLMNGELNKTNIKKIMNKLNKIIILTN
ncbi:hypothetical protein QLL95_gp1251 [Cotonvirus japonicus]|uniref:Bro-N domain-containing protein n=1 Tax=Cotonvirus japonicus TaxID=2811091 RepID=A0ABM7NRT5_9VIRU|nr:hypothetical protein QLL95_gp1251 [Cotonvirus japonicus]BCS82872.1 hypothetical protein [Cotonvirus japonicus]